MNHYRVSPAGLVHIQAAAEHGHWTAWFEGRAEVSFGGDTALVAAKWLVRSAEDLDESTLRIVHRSDDGRLAGLTVRRSGESECPECGGTGRYVGLTAEDACRACGGAGRAPAETQIKVGQTDDLPLAEIGHDMLGPYDRIQQEVQALKAHTDAEPELIERYAELSVASWRLLVESLVEEDPEKMALSQVQWEEAHAITRKFWTQIRRLGY